MSDFPMRYEGLSTEHLAELNLMSAISEKQIRNRNYQSVTADKLPPQFADYQRRDGLLIPIRTVRGEIESFQIKPNVPRIGKNGKPIKYETAANAPQVLDVPTSAMRHLGNPGMPLIITEGAKKVDAAVSAGLVTTIGLQGVYGWRGKNAQGGSTALADWEAIALNNRQVLIAFDSDVMTKPEVRGAIDRLANFLRSKKAKPCFLVLPDLPDGKKCGLDDWLALGNDPDTLNDYIIAELPAVAAESPQAAATPANEQGGIPTLVTRRMSQVHAREIDWLWPNWLPKGMLTLLGGYAGDGKSTLTAALAAAFSTGGILPDGTTAPQVNTLMVSTEDEVETVVKPRLAVHGLDEERVHTLDYVQLPDGGQRLFNLRNDVPLLRQLVERERIGLVVIDPLSSVLANGDRNNEGDVRDTLQPLVKMMEETGVAVIGVMHIGKNDGQSKAFQKLMGSTAFTALARSVWMVAELPEEFQFPDQPTRKVVGITKSNYSVFPMPVSFSRPLDAALEWHGVSPVGVEDAYTWKRKQKGGDDAEHATATDQAEAWLTEFMGGQRKLASEVEAAAKAEGFKRGILHKAKRKLELASVKESNSWYWLPPVTRINVA